VTTGIVVRSILLSTNNLLGVVELTVGSGTNFITNRGLQIDVHRTRDMLSGTSLAEESVERIVATSYGFVRRHLTIGLDAMLKAVEFPAAVTGLNTGLAHVDGDTF
jgi:hypothetical protein